MQPDFREQLRALADRHGVDLDAVEPAAAPGFDPVAFRREQVHLRLRRYADGEFHPDRLPPLHTGVAQWLSQARRDLTVRFADPEYVFDSPWLNLYGRTGSGKSSQMAHVFYALTEHATRHNRSLTWGYVSHPEFGAQTRPGGDTPPEQVIERYKSVDLLGLDDLGAANATEYGRECLHRVVDHRSQHRMLTMYASNLLLERTPAMLRREQEGGPRIPVLSDLVDPRTVSRLKPCWHVALPATDHRQQAGRVLA